MNIVIRLSIILVSILSIILIIYYRNSNLFMNTEKSENVIYYGSECMGKWGDGILNYILKLAYPNKKIEFSNEHADIIIKSHFCDQEEEWNKNKNIPYVYFSGESYNLNEMLTNPNSISFSDILIDNPPSNYFYIPFFATLFTYDLYLQRPKNINPNRKMLIYCNSNCVQLREDLVSHIANYAPENSVFALCKCKGHSDKIVKDSITTSSYNDNYKIYSDYNFAIAMENKDVYGYVTEKIMNVFLAGTIPIYWGTKYIKEIFNEKAFIYVNDFSSLEDCAKYIVELNNDKERMKQILNEPIFKNNIVPEYYRAGDYINPPEIYKNMAEQVKKLINKN